MNRSHSDIHQPILRKGLSVFAGFCMILVSACANQKDYQSLMKQVTATDNSFTAGYLDGCDSGLSTNPEMTGRMYFQDVKRFESDVSYAAGWESGFKKCSR